MIEEKINLKSMSDDDLIEYLSDLEEESINAAIDCGVILEKVNDIERRLSYRKKVDREIMEKLDKIHKLL